MLRSETVVFSWCIARPVRMIWLEIPGRMQRHDLKSIEQFSFEVLFLELHPKHTRSSRSDIGMKVCNTCSQSLLSAFRLSGATKLVRRPPLTIDTVNAVSGLLPLHLPAALYHH
jgi:hypothetical protein